MKLWMLILPFVFTACLPFGDKGVLTYGLPVQVTNQLALGQLSNSLTGNCVSCHGWITDPGELLKKGRIIPGRPEQSILYQMLQDGRMPKDGPPLTGAELDEVRGYILALVQAPSTTPVEPLPAESQAFTDLKTNLLNKQCIVCHKGMVNEVDFQHGVHPGQPDESKVVRTIVRGEMPLQIPAATDAEVQLVANYIHGVGQANPTVTFETLTKDVLRPKCLICHNGWTDETRVLKHVVAGDPENSKLYRSVHEGWMPKKVDPVSDAQLAQLRAYILALPPRPIPPETPAFTDLKTSFVNKQCIVCHKDMVEESYFQDNIIPGNVEESKLWKSIVTGRMPKQIAPATAAEIQLMADYIQGVGQATPVVNFETLTKQVLRPKCLICHKGWTDEARVLKHVVPGDLTKSKLYRSVNEGWMPKKMTPPDAAQLDALRAYIQGLKP